MLSQQFLTDTQQVMAPQGERVNQYFTTHPTGQVFATMLSSTGKIHVSLNTGARTFLGYVDTIDQAKALIARRFGAWN